VLRVFSYRGVLLSVVEYTKAQGEDRALVAIARDALGKYAWRMESPLEPDPPATPNIPTRAAPEEVHLQGLWILWLEHGRLRWCGIKHHR
jgi:hypothetical protein